MADDDVDLVNEDDVALLCIAYFWIWGDRYIFLNLQKEIL